MVDGYIAPEELALVHQLEDFAKLANQRCEIAKLTQEKAHAELRATEAEFRAAESDYKGMIMKLLWQYKLSPGDSFRQSDGLIIKKGDENGEKGNDTSSESEENQGDG